MYSMYNAYESELCFSSSNGFSVINSIELIVFYGGNVVELNYAICVWVVLEKYENELEERIRIKWIDCARAIQWDTIIIGKERRTQKFRIGTP
jgi:hypothetical protein